MNSSDLFHVIGYFFILTQPLLLIYCLFDSGDTDAVVPITATRYSIDALKLPTLVNWHPWYDNGKVSPFLFKYNSHTWHRIAYSLQMSSKLNIFLYWFRLEDGARYTKG
jgi:hypothetical protein